MTDVPSEYGYLLEKPGPRVIKEALEEFGTIEIPGLGSNPVILAWAAEVGGWQKNLFTSDEVPWCGLFAAVCVKRAGFKPPGGWQRALAWASFGTEVKEPMLGDVLVFNRQGGGHVGFYVAEDENYYHVLGGNQSDQVCIRKFLKTKLYAARRCKWKFWQPPSVRKIPLFPGLGVNTVKEV
ncbi:MAG: TIGR02594 family protein [Alphaproteobacteria bacterium]|nr:TIGR02594 family protein [Alphaproteobacteria bacterium]